jgi:hypothetical protein
MNAASLALAVQVGWLVLCGMMLFSRFVFQAAGPAWMRSFLDAWKVSITHRVWGILAFLYGAALLIGTGRAWRLLTWVDRGLAIALAAVLCGDGLLNLLPSWFGRFKERMQDAWVKRHRGTERAGDRHLFGTVNLFLGLASVLVAGLIYAYRPVPGVWAGGSVVIALILMTALIAGCQAEGRRARRHPG